MNNTVNNEKEIQMDLQLIMQPVNDEPEYRKTPETEDNELCDYCQDTSTWD